MGILGEDDDDDKKDLLFEITSAGSIKKSRKTGKPATKGKKGTATATAAAACHLEPKEEIKDEKISGTAKKRSVKSVKIAVDSTPLLEMKEPNQRERRREQQLQKVTTK